jgi:hypothetical protein
MCNHFILGPNKAVTFTQYVGPGSRRGFGISMAERWAKWHPRIHFVGRPEEVARNSLEQRYSTYFFFFVHVPPTRDFLSALFPQSCCCIIQLYI